MSSIVSPTPWSGSGKAFTAYAVSRVRTLSSVTCTPDRTTWASVPERSRWESAGNASSGRRPSASLSRTPVTCRSRGVRRHEPEAPLVSRVVEPSDVHADLHVVEDVGRLAQRGALAQVLVEDSGDLALLRLLAPPSDRRDDGNEDRERCDDEDGRAHSVSIVATSPPIGDAARDR